MRRILMLLVVFGLLLVSCGENHNELNGDNSTPIEKPGESDDNKDDDQTDEDENDGKDDVTPQIELSQQSINVGFESNSYSIEVISPCSWRAESDNDWVVVDNATGIAGTEPLSFMVERNDAECTRKATIIIKNSDRDLYAELYIIQEALAPELSVVTTTLTFPAEGGTRSVAVEANFEYDVTTNVDWVTCMKVAGGVDITLLPNSVSESRTAEVVVGSDRYNVSSVAIAIKQEAAPKHPIEFDGGYVHVTTRSTGFYEPFNVWATVNNGHADELFEGLRVEYDGLYWTYDPAYTQYWEADSVYNFVAIANVGTSVIEQSESDGMPMAISYNIADQSDLLYAKESIYAYANYAEHVKFCFYHLLSQIRFKMYDVVPGSGAWCKVTNIKMTCAAGAVVHLNESSYSWSGHSGEETIELDDIVCVEYGDSATTVARYIIPGESQSVLLTFDVETYSSNPNITTPISSDSYEVNFGYSFDVGKAYTIGLYMPDLTSITVGVNSSFGDSNDFIL